MRGHLLRLACALAASLIVVSTAAGWASHALEPTGEPGADEASGSHEHEHAGAGELATPGPVEDAGLLQAHQPRHEHALADRPGQVPSRSEASQLEHHFEQFVVRGDEGLAEMAEKGYLDGQGTLEDPYVIDGFRVDERLDVEDTTRPLVIENSYVDGQLKLNFVGEHVYVHHNYVHDLRVNENVDREGPTTAGLLEHNEIAFVGQLRHFGGTFHDNEIGPRPDGVADTYLSDSGPADLPDDVVWNFDGYHGAHVHNNTVEGRVDVKLHGHFHGSCLACPAHAHQDTDDFPPENETREGREPRSRHSYRYHVLDLENNTIRAPEAEVALRLHDRNHAGDDQTAASEPNPYLEDRHEHHAYLRIASNALRGGALVFDVVNAGDARHEDLVQETRIDLQANEVERERPRGASGLLPAYLVHAADNARIQARANAYTFHVEESQAPEGYGWAVDGEPVDATGFLLDEVNASHVEVHGTEGAHTTYGLTLDGIRDTTDVRLWDNRFDAEEADRHEG